jgi:hypothetical protein
LNFNPKPKRRELIRKPEFRLHDNTEQFLRDFLKEPKKTKR